MSKKTQIAAPAGMTGLYVEPWTPGEVYAVAANWAQASDAVRSYGDDGWGYDEHGRQVADFRHSARAALESVIRAAIEAGGDEADDDEVAAILDDAQELRDHDVAEMADMLDRHGYTFSGNNADDTAQDWLDNGFSADDADSWCEIGVWDSATAAAFRDAGKAPSEIKSAAERLVEAEDDASEAYTDADPIYAACNNDIDAQIIIDECE